MINIFNIPMIADRIDWFQLFFMGIFQTVFLFAGLVLLAIGGALILDHFYNTNKRRSYRTRGTIIGVRAEGAKEEFDIATQEQEELEQAAQNHREIKPSTVFFGNILGLFFALLIIAVPFSFMGFGLYHAVKYYDIDKNGYSTQATVISYEIYYDTDTGTTYNAVLRYQDAQGQIWQEQDRIGKSSKPYGIGHSLTIKYDPSDPARFQVDDYWHNMLISWIFIGVGGATLYLFFGGGARIAEHFKNKRQRHRSAPQQTKRRSAADFTGEIYYSVIEYVTPQGERIRTDTGWGSSSLRGRTPGKRVKIIAKTDDPYAIRKDSLGGLLFGLAFLLPSAALFIITLKEGINPAALAIISFYTLKYGGKLFKIYIDYKNLPDEEKDDKKQAFSIRRKEREETKQASPLLDKYAIRERLRIHIAQARLSSLIMLILGIAALTAGNYLAAPIIDNIFANPELIQTNFWEGASEKENLGLILTAIGLVFSLISFSSYRSAISAKS